MDGSKHFVPSGVGRDSATRLALTVDREAVGLMKQAAEIGHLIDWWLHSQDEAITPMAAYRLGRKLERFRLSARMSEGRSAKPVRAALDALKSELASHAVPPPLLDAIARADREAGRLDTAEAAPTTLERSAFPAEGSLGGVDLHREAMAATAEPDDAAAVRTANRGPAIRWTVPALLAMAGAALTATESGRQLLRALLP
jgi:hypothetical protein